MIEKLKRVGFGFFVSLLFLQNLGVKIKKKSHAEN